MDILANLIVFNILKGDEYEAFCRPQLEMPVNDSMFSSTVANILGLREGKLEEVREACPNKLRFDFMAPPNFYSLMEKVNGLQPLLPEGFDASLLPHTTAVFMSNLNRILAKKKEGLLVQQ